MTIYIDTNYKCHTISGPGLTAVETTFFDDKCTAYIEGYRFVPAGETWTRSDGVVFAGEMVSPWKPWRELDAAQRAYEQEQLESLSALEVRIMVRAFKLRIKHGENFEEIAEDYPRLTVDDLEAIRAALNV